MSVQDARTPTDQQTLAKRQSFQFCFSNALFREDRNGCERSTSQTLAEESNLTLHHVFKLTAVKFLLRAKVLAIFGQVVVVISGEMNSLVNVFDVYAELLQACDHT